MIVSFPAASVASGRLLPPFARGSALAHRLRFLVDPIGLVEECELRHGNAFGLRLSKVGWYFFSDPAHVKQIYTADPDVLLAGVAKRRIFGKLLGASSSLLLDGEAHLARRRLLLPQFRGDRMAAYTDRIVHEACDAIASIPRGRELSLHPYLHRLTLRVILSALFGPEERALSGVWHDLERFANHAVSSRLVLAPALQWDLGPHSPWGRVLDEVRRAERAVDAEIVRHRQRSSDDDLLGLLMSATDEHGRQLTESEVRDEALTLVVAGHEITSIVATWLVYAIASRPAILRAVRDELDAVVGPRSPGPDQIEQLAVLDGVVRESMRLHSTIPLGSARLVHREVRIGDFELPRGAVINVALHLLHRRADIFEQPHRFDPTRYARPANPYHWAPFGGGVRRCLGMSLALYELKLIAAMMFSRLSLEVPPRVRPVRRGAFVAPARGLRVIATERRS